MGKLLALCAGLVAGLPLQAAAACSAGSGPTLNPLIELYTSEGCSSCPPADRWLAELKAGPAVPLALHVDYWDYIGWRDRFADARFSARQREVARRTGGRVIYTPQVVLDGRDFRAWSRPDTVMQGIGQAAAKPARARISLSAEEKSAGNWSLRLEGDVAQRQGRAAAYLAVFENGLETEVRAGENAGARLRHSNVVREWFGPVAIATDGRFGLSRELKRADIDYRKAGLAAFIEDPDTGEVLQALALPFCVS